MVSGISLSSGLTNFANTSDISVNAIKTKSISCEINKFFEDTAELSSSISSSDNDDSSDKVSASSLAEGLNKITVCQNCGAIFMGSSITTCPKCGNEINSQDKDSTQKAEESSNTDKNNISDLNADAAISNEIIPPTLSL